MKTCTSDLCEVIMDGIAKQIVDDLSDDTTPATKLLAACGDGVLSTLRTAFANIPKASLTARVLHRLADENINTVPYHSVHPKWLQLYTDTAILEALSTSKSVRGLDMAIIVAGGANRLPIIYNLILILQSSMSSPDVPPRPAKRARLELSSELLYAPSPIPEILQLPPKLTCPFIIRAFAAGSTDCPRWAALDSWSSGEYLLGIAGPGRVVPVEVGRAYDEEGWSQQIMPFEEFLRRSGFFDEARDPVYLAQHSLFRQMPDLEKDISMPDFVWSEPKSNYPKYKPPEVPQLNVWIGSGAGEIISPPHTDPFFNCYIQVVGHKRVWLAPPDTQMESYSANSEEGSIIAKAYMSNTSTVPIFKSAPEEIWSSFPDLKPKSYEALLGPGDMLFMPPGWWHAMTGEGSRPGWSVSIWF